MVILIVVSIYFNSTKTDKFRICQKEKFKIYRVEQLNKFLFFKYWCPLSQEYNTIEDAKTAMIKSKEIFTQEIAKWRSTIIEIN
jgi:hypothetical protein